jgi:CTP synthase (UTP-ammonia lyase)
VVLFVANGHVRIALIGDFTPAAKAHAAIPLAFATSCASLGVRGEWQWVHTSGIADDPREQLDAFDGVWCVPASPYANAVGALAAIRFARVNGRPFLGTCGGFQHAMLEYAGSVWRIGHAAHAEMEPGAADPVIAPLSCSLVEASGEIVIEPGTRLAEIYGAAAALETYHCRYGLNPSFASRLTEGPLRVSARDAAGDVRAVELDGHPFFVATLFQPERAALDEREHPLVTAFVRAASARSP